MQKQQNERKARPLWGLIALAIVVKIAFLILPLITGVPEIDGMLAVCIGFYICACAAANFLNIILYELGSQRWASLLTQTNIWWLALNTLVLLSGLMLVITGIYRFFSRAF